MSDAAMSDEKEGMISNVKELIAGVDRERLWIMTIGLMGITFSIVFATITFFWDVLRPAGLVETQTVRSIWQVAEWIFGICSVISTFAGIKVLNFIRTWHKNYSSLKAAEKELEKKYFDRNRTQ